MLNVIRQRFDILVITLGIALTVTNDKIFDFFAVDQFAVHIKAAIFQLHLIAGQTDNPFDVIGFVVLRKLENHHIAAIRLVSPNPPLKQRHAERQRML